MCHVEYVRYISYLPTFLVFNKIGDPPFIDGGWAIAEFVVRVAYNELMFWIFSFDGFNPSSLLMCI